ncbi:MAG: alpha-glucan family phosphorylase [Bacteroidales bacterium]|nr:alpha-glucan family phosphorylase [Bacteroidales bacterium]
MKTKYIKPDYLFEISWEVCNKVGGIYTVLSSKVQTMIDGLENNYIFIGPDVWKETVKNPDFIEDKSLFREWHKSAEKEGLRIRTGRWNVPGNPVAVLVDFTPFFTEKDKIFTYFWETYELDSLSGGWDYVEPALFGYAAGKVIESFYNYYLSANDKIIAHFHEWMTGSGILYLKKNVPQIGTVFTTHATILGRSIAGNNMPLYKNPESYNTDETAKQLGIASKFSLERLSAKESDCFATVSEITSKECEYFLLKKPDVITPNGFSDVFLPEPEQFEKKRKTARKMLRDVAEAVLNQKIEKNSLFILTSGRYEFRNKGLNIFIDSLSKLNKNKSSEKEIVAFITVPGHHAGPRREVKELIGKSNYVVPVSNQYLTHVLYDSEHDPVLNRIKENDIDNSPGSSVKVIFVPAYLNGNDGIFNKDYYDLLIGFDVTVFPSYYEPWGYTPLESIAFHIPTITTSLAGFGRWVESSIDIKHHAVSVIKKNETNEAEVVNEIVNLLKYFTSVGEEDMLKARKEAYDISQQFLWKNLSERYREAYSIALDKVKPRSVLFKKKQSVLLKEVINGTTEKPEWKKILIKPQIPDELEPLNKLSMNLWWTWNYEARDLFESINKNLWEKMENNPVALIDTLSFNRIQKLLGNSEFKMKMTEVYSKFNAYMDKTSEMPEQQVAYFSMEYGLHESVKMYSGGLGILAGDYLKQASDSNVNIIGVGLMYRYGYFKQSLSLFGDQVAEYVPQRFSHLPYIPVRDKKGDWIKVSIALPGRTLIAKIWKLQIGRIPLYLLDTDIEENSLEDRAITHHLYGGDWNNRFKQELLLGVGGIRLLEALDIKPDIYHLNEGHAAFAGLERLRYLVQDEGLAFAAAMEVVRASSLFTTHTPVPAGHDTFSEDILRTYIPHYADRLNISWEHFMNLGRYKDNNPAEKFSMSVLAVKLSQEINGVSRIHGRITREMFCELYPGYFPEELNIGYVTNGVHYPTWAAKNWQQLFLETMGENYLEDQSNVKLWEKIHDISDKVVWEHRLKAKSEFLEFLKVKLQEDLTQRQENPNVIFRTLNGIDQNALYIGFARRFATYKRAHLLFTNPERLSKIVNDPDMPVRFVFTGKAHPNDKPGQDLIKRVIEISKEPEFIGKIFFLENYNITVARKLVSGVDIWLNTPTRPLEASGTSGEKAVMNGVINLSVLDGWWAEGYRENAGWAIMEARTYGNQAFQDELDAETLYQLLEDEIISMYFNKDNNDIPQNWVLYVKNTISEIAPHYTMKRMLDDYFEKFYNKIFKRSRIVRADNYKQAKKINAWKQEINKKWKGVEVVSVKIPDSSVKPLNLGDDFIAEVTLNTNGIPADNIGVDIVFGQKEHDQVKSIVHKEELKLIKNTATKAIFKCSIVATITGVYDYAFRIYPKADFLPHRQDFNLVKWV